MSRVLTSEYHKSIEVGDVVASRIYNKRRGDRGIVVGYNQWQYGYFKQLIVEYDYGEREVFSQTELVLFEDFEENKKYI